MPMAVQFVTKNTDKPNKPTEITRRNQMISLNFSRLLLTWKNTKTKSNK